MILTTHKEKLTELAVLSGGSSKLFFWLKKIQFLWAARSCMVFIYRDSLFCIFSKFSSASMML